MAKDKRYVIIGMLGRCASTWLAKALDKHPGAHFVHEPWKFAPPGLTRAWPKGFERWLKADARVVGQISGKTPCWVREVHARIPNAQWGFLWRDPFDFLFSYARRSRKAPITILGYIRRMAWMHFQLVETFLYLADELDIPVKHFLFDRYITPEGFRELAAWAGLRFRDDWKLPSPTNMSSRSDIPSPQKWPAETKRTIVDCIESMPRTSKVWHAVREKGIL